MLAGNLLRAFRSTVAKAKTNVNPVLQARTTPLSLSVSRSFVTALTTQGGNLPFESVFDVDNENIDPKELLKDAKKTLAEEPGTDQSEEDFPVYLYEVLGNTCEKGTLFYTNDICNYIFTVKIKLRYII